MAQTLRSLGIDFEEIDVDSDPGLDEQYGAQVPVLVDASGSEICRVRLDAEAIGKLR